MQAVLLIDFGSTYTKVTIVDLDKEEIVATARAGTTIETNIMEGLNHALSQIPPPPKGWNFVHKLACSSAAGGLRMVACGLVKELTAEAARRAALGAGARVLQVFSYELTDEDLEKIAHLKPDILLLAGGTDGGNKEILLKNAQKLSALPFSLPVVVAGNRVVSVQAGDILREKHYPVVVADNVMPELNVLAVDSARQAIREVFLQNIVLAKGLDKAEEYIDQVSMPTPAAVLAAAELLAKGHEQEEGWGELMIVDVGGATTDVHSIAEGLPTKAGIIIKGLPEPFAQRTVEGDLGLRYSVQALYEVGGRELEEELGWTRDKVKTHIDQLGENPWQVPHEKDEEQFDLALAKVAVDLSVKRHTGSLEVVYTPFGPSYLQYGKDLTQLPIVIGTGGILLHHDHPETILQGAVFKGTEPMVLKPSNPQFYIDQEYILSAMGLLKEVAPVSALRILKKYLKPLEVKE